MHVAEVYAVPVGAIVGVCLALVVLAVGIVLVLRYSRRKADKLLRHYRYQIELVRDGSQAR